MSAVTTTAPASAPRRRGDLSLAFQLALRELRGGVRGFAVFIACIALGVMAIAAVGSLASSLGDGLAREGRVILGADVAFSLIQREASAQEKAFLSARGTLSTAATMRAMARAQDGNSALVEIKAVDNLYPLYGTLALAPASELPALLEARNGVFGAAADPTFFARLDLKPGARITVGSATIELRSELRTEPDKLMGGIGFGPRLLISEDALRATGLLQPGSLVRWHYRLRLPANDNTDRAATAVMRAAEAAFPMAGWEARTRTNASPELGRNIERFTQYLTLVGLTALMVGGVGVANAVKSYLDRKRATIATMKSLGATGGRVFLVYLMQVVIIALIGIGIGLIAGAAVPYLVASSFGAVLPIPLEPTVHATDLLLAGAYGLLTALAFALWPLGRAHDVPVSALFRDAVAPDRRLPRRRYMVATVAVVGTLAGLAVFAAFDRRIALIFLASAAGVFVALRFVASLVMMVARRVPRVRSTALRLAIANIHRPGALTPTVVLSLGLGLSLLVTVAQIDGNLQRQFLGGLPERAPSFFFLDIQSAEAERFDAFLHQRAPDAKLDRVPILRGRIIGAKGLKAEELRPAANASWALQSDRGITYTDTLPAGSRIVQGEWWPADYQGPPLLSIEKRIADGLGLSVGDEVVVNVLGRSVAARIANIRTVDWQSLGINFVLVFSPGTFRGAPHTHIATLTYRNGVTPEQEAALLKAVSQAFPTVTTVRVKEALDAVGKLVLQLATAIRGASAITLVAAVLVLGGALAAGHRSRVYDAVILKTLGATRARLVLAYGLEYLLLGLATAVFGVAAGSVAAWLVVRDVMNLPFTWLPGPAAAAALCALALTIIFGLIGTYNALGQKPAPVLRNL